MLAFVNAKIITVAGRGAHHKATLIGPSKVKEGCPELKSEVAHEEKSHILDE